MRRALVLSLELGRTTLATKGSLVTRIMLASIVRAGPAAITDVGARLAHGQVVLDCTGVDALLPEQLEFLLAAIPAQWDFVELGECIDPQMVSPQLAEQLAAWLDHR